jgi:ATP-dependent RNA helicase DHX37/DHR1
MKTISKRFNKKGRLNRKIEIEEDVKNSKIQIEGMREHVQLENDTNMLILPSKKRKTKIVADKTETKKQLTKKQRKNFEKVIERKEKFSKRDELLKQLADVQVDSNEMKLYASVKDIGKKEKRKFTETDDYDDDFNLGILTSDLLSNSNRSPDACAVRTVNSISGSNKQKYKKPIDSKELSSTDTEEYSTDSDINEEEIQAALGAKKSKALKEESIARSLIEQIDVANKAIDSEEEKDNKLVADNAKPLVNRKAIYVHVERLEEVRESRSKLPIITEEQSIMESIFDNQIVIIW